MSKLVLLQDGQATPFELTMEEMVIGRLPECDIQLPSNMVSRKHAKIVKDGDHFVLHDLKSGNGTFVNGQRLTGSHRLSPNDRIKFGPVLCRFEAPPGAGAQEADSAISALSNASGLGNLEISDDKPGDGASTIVGAVDNAGGFGLLDVRPQEKLKAVLEISRSLAGNPG